MLASAVNMQMISREQKHSLNVNKPQSKAIKLSENAVPGQQWTTKFGKKGEFKTIVMDPLESLQL